MKQAVILSAAVLLAPFTGFAATYHYVDQNGIVQDVEAGSAAEAIVTAPNIDENSGVAIDRGLIQEGGMVLGVATEADSSAGAVLGASTEVPFTYNGGLVLGAATDGDTENYHYVDQNGVVHTVTAMSAADAFSMAAGIHVNSGVKLDLGDVDAGDTVPVD